MNDPAPTSPKKSRAWVLPVIGLLVVMVFGLGAWAVVRRGGGDSPKPATTVDPELRLAPLSNSITVIDDRAAGPMLSLQPITSEDVPDENAVKHFRLHIPIKAKTRGQIDFHDLVIHVLFYDLLDGKDVVETTASVNTHWAALPADWVDSDVEELLVDYQLPKSAGTTSPLRDRKYFGYIVRLYYQRQLQAATAEPAQLAQRYPAASALANDIRRAETPRPASTPAPQPVDLSTALPDIAAGAALGLLPIMTDEETDAKAVRRFVMHIPVKARPKVHIDVKDVMVQVLFYDVRDGKTVVQTCANVNSHWDAPPANWTHSDIEDLNVEYQLLRPENRTTALGEDRKYFGYIVRVYYEKRLQAAIAQPDILAQKFPPPPKLEEEAPSAEGTSTSSAAPAPSAVGTGAK